LSSFLSGGRMINDEKNNNTKIPQKLQKGREYPPSANNEEPIIGPDAFPSPAPVSRYPIYLRRLSAYRVLIKERDVV